MVVANSFVTPCQGWNCSSCIYPGVAQDYCVLAFQARNRLVPTFYEGICQSVGLQVPQRFQLR